MTASVREVFVPTHEEILHRLAHAGVHLSRRMTSAFVLRIAWTAPPDSTSLRLAFPIATETTRALQRQKTVSVEHLTTEIVQDSQHLSPLAGGQASKATVSPPTAAK